MANRILVHLCECERRRRRLDAAEQAAERIHELVGNLIECSYRPLGCDDDNRLQFFVIHEIVPCARYEDAAAHLADELLVLAERCELAADILTDAV